MSFRKEWSKRYHTLEDQRNEVLEVLEPLQEKLHDLVAKGADDSALRRKIKEVRTPLYDIDMERAAIARGLKIIDPRV